MRVGFTYNLKRVTPTLDGERDEEAEYESPGSVATIRAALESLGHEVAELEADRDLPARLAADRPEVVFNMAEGRGGRCREAHVPALLELLGIPYTGSDPLTLALTLDKPLAKVVVAAAGIAVPRGVTMATGEEPLDGLRFPLIAKPVHEGSSMGVLDDAVSTDEPELRRSVARKLARYREPVLVEEYVAGREVTVGVVGSPPRALPPTEAVFLSEAPHPVYSFRMKQRFEPDVRYDAPAVLSDAERHAVEGAALACFAALGCRDVARVDFRLRADGTPVFVECNPLPGLSPGFSDLCLGAEAAGIAFEELIGEILASALVRAALEPGGAA